ncbi:heavy metal translocating P-type ATPase [Acidipropionibacterium timonense]|uniref:heavy metal translocating P-type ATPase n=1 Tax=Acidipropionibacterium timonense TaxID=2161818 RepID=UPI0010308A65|nr:heavy metal translocating P-type ATPase [Acidipropionibacterium timonense]
MSTDTRAPALSEESTTPRHAIDLDIQGMSCASCAARITKKLNKIDGVIATVNYATAKAHVLAPEQVGPGDLIDVVERTGYGATPSQSLTPTVDRTGALRRRLVVAVILALPVIVLSMVPATQFAGWQWVSLALSLPVVLWCGWGFHRAAWTNLKHGSTTMDTLISLGSLASLGWSIWALVWGHAGMIGMHHSMTWRLARGDASSAIYLEAAVGVITFILGGRYIEARSRSEAGSALQALLRMGAKSVWLANPDGTETERPIAALGVGGRFVVRPGERVAADGIVVEGHSAVDNSLVTGESVPVEVGPGDHIVGSTVNASGRLVVEATAVGADTQLAQIARLVDEAQTGRSASQDLADKVSGIFVPVVISVAVLTFFLWLLFGQGIMAAFTAGIAVLIIACPCALGLATPMALLAGTGRGARMGIVIRGPEALERARGVDTVVMDKTGTVTTGVMTLDEVLGADGHTATGDARQELLALAAGLESGSEHPIARAVVAGARAEGVDAVRVGDFEALPGAGVRGVVEGQDALAGRPGMVELPEALSAAVEAAQDDGRTVLVVSLDGTVLGALSVSDAVRPTSARAIERLRRSGVRTVLLTGDNAGAARRVARELGVDEVHAEVTPSGKVDVVTALREQGHKVALIGDGVNDAAALAAADLAIAMGTGTDVAIAASDITLTRSDLEAAVDALRLSSATLRTIHGNLFWAFAYNVIAIPVAALGFLSPVVAAAAMAFSSVFVVTNSLRLTRFRSCS